MARGGFASIESMASQAGAYAAQGRLKEAEGCFRDLIAQTHVIDYEYDDWLRRLAEIYLQLGRRHEAGYIYLYLHYFDLTKNAFVGRACLPQRARVLEIERRWSDAARLYSQAGMPVHAAIALGNAEKHSEAAELWEALAKHEGLRGRPYELALVQFNYGMALRSLDPTSKASQRALVDSQRSLEQVADDFETTGERERAFDCYQILLKLGRDSDQYENLAEGYLNSIRVLKSDGLKFYVLQYYEDFITLSLERNELHAAATLYQEAADYAARNALPYHEDYQAKAAETWAACGTRYLERGAPAELAENALLAAVSGFSAVGDYQRVLKLFKQLGAADIAEKKRDRYKRIARQYEHVGYRGKERPSFPDYLKQQHAYADIWFVDLLEWELGGEPEQVALSIVGDLRYPDGIRRRALVILLTLADGAQRFGTKAEPQTLEAVAELLGELQSYAALCPLENLYRHESASVRRAAVRALRFLFFKRSFSLVRKALKDPDASVRTAAVEALRGLHFPHAFNPLVRIYRESDEESVRKVALISIGKIQSIEAGEFLLSVLRQEESELCNVAESALGAMDNPDVLPIMRQYHQIETNPRVRQVLSKLLHVPNV